VQKSYQSYIIGIFSFLLNCVIERLTAN